MDNRYHRHNWRKYSLKVHMDTLPVVSGKYPRQLSKSISKTKDDASLRTGLLPPPKGSGFPPMKNERIYL